MELPEFKSDKDVVKFVNAWWANDSPPEVFMKASGQMNPSQVWSAAMYLSAILSASGRHEAARQKITLEIDKVVNTPGHLNLLVDVFTTIKAEVETQQNRKN